MIKIWYYLFRKYAWKNFRIWSYAWKQKKNCFLKIKFIFLIFWEKSYIFYIGSVSNGVSLRPDTRQNYWGKKHMIIPQIILKMIFLIFLLLYFFKMGWMHPRPKSNPIGMVWAHWRPNNPFSLFNKLDPTQPCGLAETSPAHPRYMIISLT